MRHALKTRRMLGGYPVIDVRDPDVLAIDAELAPEVAT